MKVKRLIQTEEKVDDILATDWDVHGRGGALLPGGLRARVLRPGRAIRLKPGDQSQVDGEFTNGPPG